MYIKKITCFGAGYVGGPTMAVMAFKCPNITFVVFDINEQIIECWNNNKFPIFEQDLHYYIEKTLNKNLYFTNKLEFALLDCDLAFIAVNTPSKSYGFGTSSLDISYIDSCI